MACANRKVIALEPSASASEEYLEDILEHMFNMEAKTLPDATLIDMQCEIEWSMRPHLIDFIIEAHTAFGLVPETLFLTVNLVDRYCSQRVVYKHHYQLLGCAALLVAAKYSDKKGRVPRLDELITMCCGQYESSMLTQMELHLLNTLNWTVGNPTVTFFSRLLLAEECDATELHHMASYLGEIALYHREFVSARPSIIARGSLTMARTILSRLKDSYAELFGITNVIFLSLSHVLNPSPTLARKYAAPNMSCVSQKLADFMIEQSSLIRHTTSSLGWLPTDLRCAACSRIANAQPLDQKMTLPDNTPLMALILATPEHRIFRLSMTSSIYCHLRVMSRASNCACSKDAIVHLRR